MSIVAGYHYSYVECDSLRCQNCTEDIYYKSDAKGVEAKFNDEKANAKSVAEKTEWSISSDEKATCPRCQRWKRYKSEKGQ
jgi:uncharacterized paraquat-inducible protein A